METEKQTVKRKERIHQLEKENRMIHWKILGLKVDDRETEGLRRER